MMKRTENESFDISRRNQLLFRHYQILIRLLSEDKTEHHNLEIFTTGPDQLQDMRRIYAKTYKKMEFRTLSNVIKNN